jgi:hypothetical protein
VSATALSIEPVHARAELAVSSLERTAEPGRGGQVLVVRLRASGPMTSSDPRLEGVFEADAILMVDESGRGASRDDWRIVDAETGSVKVTGTSHGVHGDAGPIRALAIGWLEDGSRLFAHALVTLPPPDAEGPIIVEYGGAGFSRGANPATIMHGSAPPLLGDGAPRSGL